MNCVISAANLKIFGRAIQSLSKIPGEEIHVEATNDGLSLRTLNSSRSAYCCFLFKPQFFLTFIIGASDQQQEEATTSLDETSQSRCRIPMKSALLMFKSMIGLEKSIETCKIWIDVDRCSLFFQLSCKFGVVRTFSFVLIDCESMNTLYDRKNCQIKIVAPGTLLVEGVNTNFKSGLEDVTLKVTFCELTLKNCVDDAPDPDKCVKTQLRYDAGEFDEFKVPVSTDVTFCLKELRAFLSFVEAFRLSVSMYFDAPGKPIIFALDTDPNFHAEMVLASYLIQEPSEINRTNSQTSAQIARQRHSEPLYDESDIPPPRVVKANGFDRASVSMQAPLNDVSDTLHDENESMQVDDVLPPSPPPKKPRSFLFDGWSQQTMSTTMFQSQANIDEPIVFAPDSDLEDY